MQLVILDSWLMYAVMIAMYRVKCFPGRACTGSCWEASFETCCPDSYPGHGDCAGRGRSATEASDVLVISDVFD